MPLDFRTDEESNDRTFAIKVEMDLGSFIFYLIVAGIAGAIFSTLVF
jgi:hypothetical protein